MNRLQHRLAIHFWLWLALTLVVIVLFETELLPSGYLAYDKSMESVLAFTMELITIAAIPFVLWMFRWKRVSEKLKKGGELSLYKLGLIREYLLIIPMFVNALLYYAFMNVAFGYMGIIIFLSLFFIYPSQARWQQEMNEHQKDNTAS